MHSNFHRGQAAAEYLALLAFVLLLVALAVVLLREGLLVTANESIQAALHVQRQALNASPALSPTPPPAPTPEPGRQAGGLLDVLVTQVGNSADFAYQTLRAWAGYAWFFTALGLGALIAFGTYRMLRGR